LVLTRRGASPRCVSVNYAGRERMVFVAERDVHEHRLVGYRLPLLPPEVRVAVADADLAARRCHPRLASMLDRPEDAGGRRE
jgi:hypothetical protein